MSHISRIPFKKFSLVSQERRLPNGLVAMVEFVEHPGAVLIVPFMKKDKIILMRQYRLVLRSYLYEFPAGTRKNNEAPLTCAKRELIEEAGFRAGKLIRLGHICPVPAYSTEIITIYKATQLTPASAPKDPDEIITVSVVSKSQVVRLFHRGLIKDAKTICALAFCGWV